MTEKTAKKQPAHKNPDVQFKKDISGNPSGRPVSLRNATTIAVEGLLDG